MDIISCQRKYTQNMLSWRHPVDRGDPADYKRNVATKEQQDYISGKRYEAQKNINKFKGNQYTKESGFRKNCGNQEDSLPHNKNWTAYKIGLDEGVSSRTIEVNAGFARGVDAIREVSPALAEKILKPAL